MPTVSDVCSFLDQLAPPELSESWDNTGLLVGRKNVPVYRLMTCLTLTPNVAEEAIRRDVQLIVTHHPLLFRGTKQITDDTVEGVILLALIQSQTAVFSPHTRFDSAAGGINQQLAESFGLESIRPLLPMADHPDRGGGRIGVLPVPVPLPKFLSTVAQAVSADRLEYCGKNEAMVRVVGVGCGAAESFLAEAAAQHCDTFVTGEARFHSALDAQSRGISLVLTGHFASERPAVQNLADVLQSRFPDVRVFASDFDLNPLTLFQPAPTDETQ